MFILQGQGRTVARGEEEDEAQTPLNNTAPSPGPVSSCDVATALSHQPLSLSGHQSSAQHQQRHYEGDNKLKTKIFGPEGSVYILLSNYLLMDQ